MQNHQDMTEREQRIRNRAAEIDAVDKTLHRTVPRDA